VNSRDRITALLDFEIEQAKGGNEAWLKLKINNFADTDLGLKLYEASRAGVKIQIICRSRFTIIPGIEGMSENIEAISIVDNYLEHSRFFIFNHGGQELTFIGSADWQTRNIDRRVEVTCPIYRPQLKNKLRKVFEFQWSDNQKARVLDSEMSNAMVPYEKKAKAVRSQKEVYLYLLEQNKLRK
jgi:polyphosphate kinase